MQTQFLATIALLALLVLTINSCSFPMDTGGPMQSQYNLETELRAIEELNQHDMKAALASDTDAIISQWTDDFTVLPPTGPILRGRSANSAAAEQGKEQLKAMVPVDYVVEFEEVTVSGNYAFEWGTYRGTVRSRDGGEPLTYSGKLMRILQRQPDGAWKMHRTMMTSDSQAR
jgi:ketosteroid isomerase-like protein